MKKIYIINILSSFVLLAAAITFIKPVFAASGNINPQVIEKAQNYLNNIRSLKASFTQAAPDGSVSTGTLYLKRPGQMRWEYNPPTPVIMVSATGAFLRYYDYELEQISEIPIEDTLAGFLAEDRVDFKDKRIKVLFAYEKDGVQSVRLTQHQQEDEGELEFIFETKPYKLRSIILKDAKGEETNISLANAEYNISMEPSLFVLKNPRFNKRHQR